jgi:hypothetical protein
LRCRGVDRRTQNDEGIDLIVLAVLIVIAVGAGLVVLAGTAFSRHRHFNEVDRFHRASRMTSEWARAGVTRPVFGTADGDPQQREGAGADQRDRGRT